MPCSNSVWNFIDVLNCLPTPIESTFTMWKMKIQIICIMSTKYSIMCVISWEQTEARILWPIRFKHINYQVATLSCRQVLYLQNQTRQWIMNDKISALKWRTNKEKAIYSKSDVEIIETVMNVVVCKVYVSFNTRTAKILNLLRRWSG